MDTAILAVLGSALAVCGYLVRILWEQAVQRRPSDSNGPAMAELKWVREDLKNVREDVKGSRGVLDSLRELLQAQVGKIATLEYRIAELERRMNDACVGE